MQRVWNNPLVHQCALLLLCAGSAMGAAVATENARQTKPIGSDTQQKQWLEGLACLGTGQIGKGSAIIADLATAGVTDKRVRLVSEWVGEYEKGEGLRRDRVRGDFDKYVAWAKEDIAAGRRHQALVSISMAHSVADDPEAFLKEGWVLEACRKAAEAGREYEEESHAQTSSSGSSGSRPAAGPKKPDLDSKWYAAARVYARLSELFPHDKEYRESLQRCQDHIRLELTYEPDSEWESSVQDITKDMASEAFLRVSSDYLREPNFKDAVVGALKQVLLMTRTPKLSEVFKKLDDADALKEFRNRIEARLKYAETKDSLTVHDLIAHFERVLEINEEIGLMPPAVLIREFTYGALQPLDKFSDMIWPADVLEFNKSTQGRFSGVGIQIRKNEGEPILVVSPLKGSPAYAAGVRPGDLITKISGKSAAKYTITRAVREITGPPGTTVNLTFKRPGQDEEFDLKLERQEISVESVKGFDRDGHDDWKYLIDPELKIGYIRLSSFTENSFDELKAVLGDLTKQGLRGLIFDLRDNPGGPLKAAVDVSDMFLPTNKQIVSTRDRNGSPWDVSSSNQKAYTDFPMIVLTSKYSASASEIVTGALQVHKRALILGERTYGKGSVQQVLPLNRSRVALLKLTTQLYYLPDGRCLHKEDDSATWGVDPNIAARVVPKERIKLYDLQLKREILKGKDQENLSDDDIQKVTSYRSSATQPAGKNKETGKEESKDKPASQPATDSADEEDDDTDGEDFIKREDPNDYPESDSQLDLALLLMRVRLETDEPWPTKPPQMAATAAPATGG